MVQTAVVDMVRKLPAGQDAADVEWGVSTDMGSHLLAAADLAPTATLVIARQVAEAMVKLYRQLNPEDTRPGGAAIFFTGNSHHVYLDTLLPIEKRVEWFTALGKIPGVDEKWTEIALKKGTPANQGILRWSAGRSGRCAPSRIPL
jgi:hypothetical protein